MTYDDAIEAKVSRAEAKREIRKHGLDWIDFIFEVGDKSEYLGSEVLDWLGY